MEMIKRQPDWDALWCKRMEDLYLKQLINQRMVVKKKDGNVSIATYEGNDVWYDEQGSREIKSNDIEGIMVNWAI